MLRDATGDGVLEGIVTGFGVPLGDQDGMDACASCCDWFVVHLCCDKLAANILMCKWLMGELLSSTSLNMLGHVEPCGAHGVATAKTRATLSSEISASANTFSRMTRESNFAATLAGSVDALISRDLKRKLSPRPPACKAAADKVFELLFGANEPYLFRKGPNGEMDPTDFVRGVKRFLRVLDLRPGANPDSLTHWCCVEETALDF